MLNKKDNKVKIFLIILLVCIIILLRYSGLVQYFSIQNIKYHQLLITNFIRNHYTTSVLIYIAINIAAILLMMPITIMLNIAAGFFFGVIPGICYGIVSAAIGATFSLLVFRYVLSAHTFARYTDKLQRFKANFNKNGVWYLLSLQLLPITPYPIINICAALSGISIWTFLWTTVVGILPGLSLYTFAGKQLREATDASHILSWHLIVVLIILSMMVLLPILIRKRKN